MDGANPSIVIVDSKTIDRGARDGAQGGEMGTRLEGIRQKVFLDRYSLKDRDGRPPRAVPEQVWERVARGIAAVEPTPEKREHWTGEFYRAMEDFRFVPGGRILAGAGDRPRGHLLQLLRHPLARGQPGRHPRQPESHDRGHGPRRRRRAHLSTLRPVARTSARSTAPPRAPAPGPSSTRPQPATSSSRALPAWRADDHAQRRPPRRRGVHHSQEGPPPNQPRNLSVCVSDAFMEAVKQDADWKLVWNGEVRKVVKARYLWD